MIMLETQGLNNKVDNNTKIVYISSNKLPKLPLQSIGLLIAVHLLTVPKLTRNHVTDYFEAFDLRIVYDEIATGGLNLIREEVYTWLHVG